MIKPPSTGRNEVDWSEVESGRVSNSLASTFNVEAIASFALVFQVTKSSSVAP